MVESSRAVAIDEQPAADLSLRNTAPARGRVDTPVSGPQAPRSPGLLPGTLVGGRYAIVRLLGRGGMGAVFEAVQRPIGRRVALKVLNPLLSGDPDTLRRFLTEARVANQVQHRNVVQVTDFGEHEAQPFLVMELLEGESLAARLEREGPLDPSAAIALLAPVLRAMAHVHERGVVHRDLKPDNIFLAREAGTELPVPRVLDLGIAVALGDESQRVTATGAVLGTPAYMAPEQVVSSRSVTALADQYALGCVLYEMLTGRLPIEADNLHGLLLAKTTSEPTDIRGLRPELPEVVAAAAMRAVARDPGDRFGDVASLLDALTAPAPKPAAAVAREREPVRPEPAPAAPARARRPVVAAVLALTVLAAAAAALSSRSPSPLPHPARAAPTAIAPPLAMAPPAPEPEPLRTAPPSPSPAPPAMAVAPPAPAPERAHRPSRSSPRSSHAPREQRPPGPRLRIDPENPLRDPP